ncbi:MAG TPA: fluoride efflux transporter CrcB [Phnomibacter sp.]|nr:fluoride efflux transporter CrcB [Phnomibacter sp.]
MLLVGSGSFLGGVARYLASRYIHSSMLSSFPYGTFWVNITGCLLIGLIYGIFERSGNPHTDWRLFLTVGFCGGFTTFSTFANENMSLLRDGNYFNFALYTGLSVFLGLLAVYAGNFIIKIL